jgi:hypothetical protein
LAFHTLLSGKTPQLGVAAAGAGCAEVAARKVRISAICRMRSNHRPDAGQADRGGTMRRKAPVREDPGLFVLR